MKLVQQVTNRAYTPNMMGPEIYFYACETYQHRSKHLDINPILDTVIMTAALRAFSAEHYGEQFQRMAESWDIVNGTIDSPQDEYEQFKVHYNWQLASTRYLLGALVVVALYSTMEIIHDT